MTRGQNAYILRDASVALADDGPVIGRMSVWGDREGLLVQQYVFTLPWNERFTRDTRFKVSGEAAGHAVLAWGLRRVEADVLSGGLTRAPDVSTFELAGHAVVGARPPVEHEGVCVGLAALPDVGVADVGEERRSMRRACVTAKVAVAHSSHKTTDETQLPVRAKRRQAEAVRIRVALMRQGRRRVEN